MYEKPRKSACGRALVVDDALQPTWRGSPRANCGENRLVGCAGELPTFLCPARPRARPVSRAAAYGATLPLRLHVTVVRGPPCNWYKMNAFFLFPKSHFPKAMLAPQPELLGSTTVSTRPARASKAKSNDRMFGCRRMFQCPRKFNQKPKYISPGPKFGMTPSHPAGASDMDTVAPSGCKTWVDICFEHLRLQGLCLPHPLVSGLVTKPFIELKPDTPCHESRADTQQSGPIAFASSDLLL